MWNEIVRGTKISLFGRTIKPQTYGGCFSLQFFIHLFQRGRTS